MNACYWHNDAFILATEASSDAEKFDPVARDPYFRRLDAAFLSL